MFSNIIICESVNITEYVEWFPIADVLMEKNDILIK